MRGRCDECGFVAETVSPSDAIVALRSFGRRWRGVMTLPEGEPDDVLRRRPAPDVWSALEYAAHTRDAVAFNGWAMDRALTEDNPVFEWPDGELRHEVARAYADLEPAAVLDELAANCERTAVKAEKVDAGDWRRPATLPDRDGGEVDAIWFLHHSVHEASHHLRDVQRVLETVRRQR